MAGLKANTQFERALLTAAQHGQDAMRGQSAQGFVEVKPVSEICAVGFFALSHL